MIKVVELVNRLLDKIEDLQVEIESLKLDIKSLELDKRDLELEKARLEKGVVLYRDFLLEQKIRATRVDKIVLIEKGETEDE